MLHLLFERRFSEYFARFHEQQLPWIFVHVPKTAGSSITSELAQVLQPYKNIHVDYEKPARGYNSLMEDAVSEFIDESRSRRYALASGHIKADHLEAIEKSLGPSCYLSMLRHPVQRVISDYHWQSSDAHPGHEQFRERYPTIRDYSEAQGENNKLAKHLVPRAIWTKFEPEKCISYIFDRYHFLGVQEMYPLNLRLLFSLIGEVRTPKFRIRVNKKEAIADIDDTTVAIIKSKNDLDLNIHAAFLTFWKPIRDDLIIYLNNLETKGSEKAGPTR